MVLQLGLSPDYVLDQIQLYEISALMKYSHYKSKDNWEQARLISFLIAQANSTKRLKIEDIIKFPWEADKEKDGMSKYTSEAMTQDDISYLEEQAELMKQFLD